MINDILERLEQIETSKNNIVTALSDTGSYIPEGTLIDKIAPYIDKLGVFRGTREAYEIAYAAGNIPEGTIVIIDDVEQITKSDAGVLISYTTIEELGTGRHHISCTPVVINAPVGYKFSKVDSVSTFSPNVEPKATISSDGLKLHLGISGWVLKGVEIGQTATMRVSYSATCDKICDYKILPEDFSPSVVISRTATQTAEVTERLLNNGMGETTTVLALSADDVVIEAPEGCTFNKVISVVPTCLGLPSAVSTGTISEDGKTLTIDTAGDPLKAGEFPIVIKYEVECLLPEGINSSQNTFEGNLVRIQRGINDNILALNKIGSIISKETLIEDIASYINELGMFRGTMAAYEEAYAAGKIPEGTIIIIDESSETTAALGKAILGKMILGIT